MANPPIKQRPISGLRPSSKNARTHSPEQVKKIAASIKEFGFTVPILIDRKGEVIAGHERLLAATELGLKRVPTIRLDHLTPKQVRAYRIADNRLTDLGGWDETLLAAELESLKSLDFNIELTGFDLEDLGRMLPSVEDDPPAPEPPKKPVTKKGDIWIMGKHRLICGDSTEGEIVKRLLRAAKPNLMVTDPPYGVKYEADWRNKTPRIGGIGTKKNYPARSGAVQNDDVSDWSTTFCLYAPPVAYIWGASLHVARTFQMLESAGYCIRTQIIWRKQHFQISRGHYHWQHEPCWYAVQKGKTASWVGDRKQSTVWDIQVRVGAVGPQVDFTTHATVKPIECMERPIRNHSGDVYDPFVGSGTTLIAAERQNRTCYAIEISPAYCDVSVQRWQEYTGKKAKRKSDGAHFPG